MVANPDIEAVVKASGGVAQIHKSLADFTRRSRLLDSKASKLVQERPNEWVAIPEGDQLVFADSLDELLAKLREAGKPTQTAAIRRLDPNPRILIV
jgi:hypothetical protein